MLPTHTGSSKSLRWFTRRRRLVLIAVILCFCFLFYQIVSLIQLNWDLTDFTLQSRAVRYDSDDNLVRIKGNKFDPIEFDSHYADRIDLPVKMIASTVSTVFIPGVLPKHYDSYKKSEYFKCLESGEMIKFDAVNDDYCDCSDGTDEPSTNACKNNVFYCKVHTFSGKQSIASSNVNDGICDCCDGSDEWLNHTLPIKLSSKTLKLIETSKTNVYYSPCVDRC